MAANELAPWINSAGEDGFRNSMAEFQGDGSTTKFDFNFSGGYLRTQDVKAYIYDTQSGLTTDISSQFTWVGPNSIEYTPAIPATQFLIIYRDTQKTVPLVDFTTNAGFTESNLDLVTKQAVFVAAEMVDRFDSINASSADAVERSFTALTTANAAKATADAASADSSSAVATANTASSDAQTAVHTANLAKDTADGIDAKAQSALNNSQDAVATSHAAKDTADGIDAKAQSALSNSNSAVSTANTASQDAALALTTALGVDDKATQALTDSTWLKDHAFVRYSADGSIPSPADLDTYVEPGAYHQNFTAGATSGANYPEPVAGLLLVYTGGTPTNFVYQEYWTYYRSQASPSRRYYRSRYAGGTFSAWRKLADQSEAVLRAQMVGPVSQSSGVPTGAIIESDTNSNGSYVAYADGTQFCFKRLLLPACTINTGTSVVWNFPKPFATFPLIQHSTTGTLQGGNQEAVGIVSINGVYVAAGQSSMTLNSWAYRESMSDSVYFDVTAIGRWF